MVKEHNSQIDCGTWVLRPAQECYDEGKKPIDMKWVFDTKVDATTGRMKFWKARIVARGDQQSWQDFLETYAGVCRHSTLRLLLAIAALLGLVLTAADVSTAYLHAPLRGVTVWMKQPEGFAETIGGEPALCKLKMALYGLRQSAREWAITLREWLIEYGFKRCTSDPYMFILHTSAGILILLLWVDDIFLGHTDAVMRATFMAAFCIRFRVTDLGPMTQALGASVTQDVAGGTVSFGLERYIQGVARRFGLSAVNDAFADIPLPVKLAKECTEAVVPDIEVVEVIDIYRVMTGIVVFVATFARPDVAFAAHFLSSFGRRPGHVHLRLARRVLSYLVSTAHMHITYRRSAGSMQANFKPLLDGTGPDEAGAPHMPVDTDHGISRSITGWLFILAGAGVSWGVRSQQQPSLSSTEAEMYGISTAVADLVTCVNVACEMGFTMEGPVEVFSDSRGARLLVSDVASAARCRHIHRRWFFVRFFVDEGLVVIAPVKGCNNPANSLTKPVGGGPFARDRSYQLGLR